MTVPYSNAIPGRFSTCGWMKAVVCRWTGGIYPLLLHEGLFFILMWYTLWFVKSQITDPVMDPYITVFRAYQSTIRIMLGFMLVYYYQEIYARARRIFFAIPFPDSTFVAVNSFIDSSTARGLLLKQTIFRYILATTFQSYHASSEMFRHSYPHPWKSMEELGLLTQEEVTRLKTASDDNYPYYGELSFLPMAWATMVVRKVFEEGLMIPRQTHANGGSANGGSYPTVVNMAMKAVHDYRLQYGTMLFEVYFPFPLYLSQLVTVVTYAYFAVALVAQQNLSNEPFFYFPIFTSIEFFVYIGALRVGQTFTNPLGEDSNCFEMVASFNRNLRLAHVYGGFGPPDKHDMVRNPLPIVDLTEKQSRTLRTVPLNFYRTDLARVACGGGGGGGGGGGRRNGNGNGGRGFSSKMETGGSMEIGGNMEQHLLGVNPPHLSLSPIGGQLPRNM